MKACLEVERGNFWQKSAKFTHLLFFCCLTAGRSCHPSLKNGSVLEVNVKGFQVDYYPYHLARSDRKHWPMYRQASIPHTHWQNQSLDNFLARFLDLVERNKTHHTPLGRLNQVINQLNSEGPFGKITFLCFRSPDLIKIKFPLVQTWTTVETQILYRLRTTLGAVFHAWWLLVW